MPGVTAKGEGIIILLKTIFRYAFEGETKCYFNGRNFELGIITDCPVSPEGFFVSGISGYFPPCVIANT
jgi:hypothetical protein